MRGRCRRIGLALLGLAGILGGVLPAEAHEAPASIQAPEALRAVFKDVGFDLRLDAQVPLDLQFRDETGRTVPLREYFGDTKPVILSLVYYNCATLCPMILDGLVRSLAPVSFDIGKQFAVLTVSIDPRDTPALATARKAEYVRRYGRPGAAEGWHFLTGEEAAIQSLARAVGFRYVYDARTDQFAHAAGIVMLTPQGKVARYFYGLDFPPRALRLGLVETAAGSIGTPVDRVMLYCYKYDPLTGKYGLVVMNVLRLTGLGTVLALGAFILLMLRRERNVPRRAKEAR